MHHPDSAAAPDSSPGAGAPVAAATPTGAGAGALRLGVGRAIAVVGALAVLALAAGILVGLTPPAGLLPGPAAAASAVAEDGPEKVAGRYLAAIADGDARAANRLARVRASGRERLLTDEVLAAATRIREPRVDSSTSDREGRTAAVIVGYELDGRSVDDRLELRRDDRGWYVSRGLAVRLPSLPQERPFRVRGSEERLDGSAPDAVVYPGRYELTPALRIFAFSGDPAVAVAGGRATLGEGFAAGPSAAFAAEIEAAIGARLRECATSTDLAAVRECGIALAAPERVLADGARATVTIESLPQVRVGDRGADGDFTLTGGAFLAHVVGRDAHGRSAEETVAGVVGDLRAKVRLEGDAVRVSFGADDG